MSDKLTEGKSPDNGQFVEGNRFWEARSTSGRKPIFDNADDLWNACCEYFQWNQENPLYEVKAFAFQGEVTKEKLPKMRAMTINGLTLFLDISVETWHEWRRGRPDFSEVISRAENIIFQQKFEGASADLLNANIISRDLGLIDKKEVDGSQTITINKKITPVRTKPNADE